MIRDGKVIDPSYPRIQLVPSNPSCSLRPNTMVRMSLVDVASSPGNIMDHFHCLVDCQKSRTPEWSVVTQMGHDGTVAFNKFGIVKSLEVEKVIYTTR